MYSFKLKDSYTNKIIDVNPYYSGAEITTDYQNNRYTKTLNGNFQFIGADYEAIISKPITTTFYVTMYKDGVPYPDGNAKFTFNDIETDYDKKIINVKMQSNTLQNDFNSILSNEYDLKQIDIKKTSINYSEKMIMQLYCLGDDECANLQYGNVNYQECTVEESWLYGHINSDGFFGDSGIDNPYGIADLVKSSGMVQTSFINAPTLPIHGAWMCTDPNFNASTSVTIDGATKPLSELQCVWYHESGVYYAYSARANTGGDFYYFIKYVSNDSIYASTTGGLVPFVGQNMFNQDICTFTTSGVDYYFEQPKVILLRMIKPKETTCEYASYYEDGKVDNDFEFTQNKYHVDIVCGMYYNVNNERYDERLNNITNKPDFLVTSATQTQETIYGKAQNGKYFTYPTQAGDWFQIGKSVWSNYSIWFKNTNLVDILFDNFTEKEHKIEAYNISDVFNAVCKNAGLNLVFESSYFNTLNSFFNNQKLKPVITQVTNIKTPDGVPSTVNKIRLGELLEFLCQLYNLSYKITNNKLILEHSYINDGATIDLTQYISTRSYKNVTHNQSKIKYNLEDLYKRKAIKMQEASDLLGVSNIVSDYESVNDISIEMGQFYTDYFYIINSSNIETGYFFAMLNENNQLINQEVTIKGFTLSMKNIYAALPIAVAINYPFEDLSENLEIDGVLIEVTGKKRCKRQELLVSDSLTLTENFLIKTDIGVANVDKISLSLEEKVYKLTLRIE